MNPTIPLSQATSPAKYQKAILADLGGFATDPLGYVLWNFPWGVKGTELENTSGPRLWQGRLLNKLGKQLKEQYGKNALQPIMEAISSGHGIGKGCFASWIVKWGLSTCPDSKFVVTANTEQQLKGKTWAELAKWHRLGLDNWMFTLTATSLYSNEEGHDKTWRADMVPWSEEKSEAFAGLHNKGRRLGVIMDEASAIPDKIWEVTEGALTDADTEIFWLALGNPTRNTGRFKECFNRYKHRWGHESIDARNVEGTNKEQMKRWIDDYGEDSDFVKVRVRGMFPSASFLQFIDGELVRRSMERREQYQVMDPVVMSIDWSRGGDDNTVIAWRHGLDMRSRKQVVIPGSETRDTMRLVDHLMHLIETTKPEVVFGDATGIGGPPMDLLRRKGVNALDLQFGAKSPDPKYANMRSFLWGRLKKWMQDGGALENNADLENELCSVEYSHNNKDQLLLEKKEHMKERGLASPDRGDAAAMCCAPYSGKAMVSHVRGVNRHKRQADLDYDPYV